MKDYNRIPPAKILRAIAIASRYTDMRWHLYYSYTKESVRLDDILADIEWEWGLNSWFFAN